MTYGDGVSDIDIHCNPRLPHSMGKLVTLTAVQPRRPIWRPEYRRTHVLAFQEKPKGEGGWINGGFFVLSPPLSTRSKMRWMFEKHRCKA